MCERAALVLKRRLDDKYFYPLFSVDAFAKLVIRKHRSNVMITYTASQSLTYEQVDKALYLLSTRTRPDIEFGYEASHLLDRPEVEDAVIRLIADENYSAYVPLEINANLDNTYWRIVRIVNHDANKAKL